MHLVCPNCRAEYVIPDDAIPPSGRDVQCASCTRSWYQLPIAGSGGVSDGLTEEPEADPDETSPPRQLPDPSAEPARRVDPEVLRILREEADFESRAREKARRPGPEPVTQDGRLARLQAVERNRGPLEPPPDDAAVEAAASEDRIPRLASDGPAPSLRQELRHTLPARVTTDPVGHAIHRRRRGFQLGFAATAGLLSAALVLYLVAPLAADRWPQTEAVANALLEQGDRVRSAVNAIIDKIADRPPA